MTSKYKVSFSKAAILDLNNIEFYFLEEIYNASALSKLLEKFYSFTDLLEEQPWIGSSIPQELLIDRLKSLEIRKFPIMNYIIIYEIRDKRVEILGFINAWLDYPRVINKRLR